ncbi:MAG: type II and III secretion system protein family protein [Pseudomonadota bacterium]
MNRGSLTRDACMLALALVQGAPQAAGTLPAKGAQPGIERSDSGPRCSGEAARPASMTLQVGKSNLMRLPEPVQQRSIGNPAVAQALLVAPDTLYLVGVDVGSTNMIIQGRSGACSVVDIVVAMDPAGLQTTLAALLPEEKNIRVVAVADSLVLTGTVADAPAAARAMELALAYLHRPLRPLQNKGDERSEPVAGNGASPAAAPETRVVNMLSISAPQQVMLEVKVAEVSKTLLERLEMGATLRWASGSWAGTLLTNFLSGNAKGQLKLGQSSGNQVTADAQKQDGLVRILAEPTVMAISGQEGSFLAGGRIFIPVAQDNNKVTLEEKEFGVGLRFTPTVLSGGRINLRVAPEVSEVSHEGIGISATGLAGNAILPLITTRRASTTVQLYDGQSFAIGGLIKNNLVTNIKGLPFLAEVPILGALFRSTDYQQDRSELVFVVTAHLVKPLPPGHTLPTDTISAPTRSEMLLGGRLEGEAKTRAAQAGARTDGFELK